MNTNTIRNKLLGMFPEEAKAKLEPILNTLIARSNADGIITGRREAATMIEVLVLGGEDAADPEKLRELMRTLRGED